MKKDRPLQKAAFPEFGEHLPDQLRADFGFVFAGRTVLRAQLMGAQFDRLQLRIAGVEKDAAENLFFFSHGCHPVTWIAGSTDLPVRNAVQLL